MNVISIQDWQNQQTKTVQQIDMTKPSSDEKDDRNDSRKAFLWTI